MPFYKDSEQIYNVMQALFENMSNMSPDPVDALVSTHMVISVQLTDPDARITIHGRRRPVRIEYGAPNGRADLVIGMTSEILHRILLDDYSVKQGFMKGDLTVQGPIWKAMSFVDVFKNGREFYPKILQDQGLNSYK